jgi:hypothetical protein
VQKQRNQVGLKQEFVIVGDPNAVVLTTVQQLVNELRNTELGQTWPISKVQR